MVQARRCSFVLLVVLALVYLRPEVKAESGFYCDIEGSWGGCSSPASSAGSGCAWYSGDCADYCGCMMGFDFNECGGGSLQSCSFTGQMCLDLNDQCDPEFGPPCCEGTCGGENYCQNFER
jgi:hypothetical protein